MDSYIEYMVKKKHTVMDSIIRVIAIAIDAVFWGAGILFIGYGVISTALLMVGLLGAFAIYYVVYPTTDIEYEYLYVDRTISVDKIMGKEKRKHLADYTVDKMLLLCPVDSYKADDYKNQNYTEKNYSSDQTSDDYKLYSLYYEGNQKVLLDLPTDFVKMVQNNAPRKVFTE